MTRFGHWPTLLSVFLDSRRETPFSWGAHDCCLFACDALRVITGTDFASAFRGRYRSRYGALRCLREVCAEATVDAAAVKIFAAHALEPVWPQYAQRGDVLALSYAGDTMLGIISLDGMPIIASDTGWRICDRACAVRAWRV